MRRSDEPHYSFKPRQRTTQIIFGERQNLRAVLISIRNFEHKYGNLQAETEVLHRMIDARTTELHQINPIRTSSRPAPLRDGVSCAGRRQF